jgi:hypothetical protein
VPAWIWVALGAALGGQVAVTALSADRSDAQAALPPAPGVHALRLASFGEPEALARIAMLYVQGFAQPDFPRLMEWLAVILELDPRSAYPLFSAARVYAETQDAARSRMALDFVYREFLRDPDRRWPWLAHGALLAKHRLKDLPLARRYAAAVARHATKPDVPLWARQMEIFILEDMNELEAATIMLGGLLESGAVSDPAEARFLAERLKALEARLGGSR